MSLPDHLPKGWKVKDLQRFLEDLDPDMPVVLTMCSDYVAVGEDFGSGSIVPTVEDVMYRKGRYINYYSSQHIERPPTVRALVFPGN